MLLQEVEGFWLCRFLNIPGGYICIFLFLVLILPAPFLMFLYPHDSFKSSCNSELLIIMTNCSQCPDISCFSLVNVKFTSKFSPILSILSASTYLDKQSIIARLVSKQEAANESFFLPLEKVTIIGLYFDESILIPLSICFLYIFFILIFFIIKNHIKKITDWKTKAEKWNNNAN